MIIDSIKEIFIRDLHKVKEEISSYSEEEELWKIKLEIKNSAGNLCLHICGNLQHFIGAALGNTGYIRNRDAEFSKKKIAQKDLLKEIEITIKTMESVLNNLNDENLFQKYPLNGFGDDIPTHFVILQLLVHLNYHLGQINYHRRMISN